MSGYFHDITKTIPISFLSIEPVGVIVVCIYSMYVFSFMVKYSTNMWRVHHLTTTILDA